MHSCVTLHDDGHRQPPKPAERSPTAAILKALYKVNLHSSSLAGKRPVRRGFPASRDGAQCTTACFCARSFPRNNKCNAWRDRVSGRALTRALQAGVVSDESTGDANRRPLDLFADGMGVHDRNGLSWQASFWLGGST